MIARQIRDDKGTIEKDLKIEVFHTINKSSKVIHEPDINRQLSFDFNPKPSKEKKISKNNKSGTTRGKKVKQIDRPGMYTVSP